MKFRKITALAGSLLMAGVTVATAAAANYPAPFVDNGVADVAIVYGTGAGVSQLDEVQAGNIQSSLASDVTGGTTTVTGGESFMLDKSSNHFNFNNALNAVFTDLDDGEMDFLVDGTYKDGDIDEEYEQKITLSTKTLGLFADNDYDNDAPTVGFKWDNGEEVLNYEMDLDDEVLYSDMVETDMPILGGNYYVLAASATQIDILDSAESQTLTEDETVTVTLDDETYTVSVAIYSDGAKFTVNGEASEKLTDGGYDEVLDEVYVVAKEVNYVSKDTGVSAVEFALGKGKIELIDGEEAELNTNDIDGLEVTLTDGSTNSSYFDKLTLTWKSDRETFLTVEDAITMPGFEVIKLTFGGLEMPSDSEMVSLENGETLMLSMDNYDLPVAWVNSTAAYLGEEDYELIVATSVANYTSPAVNLTGGLDLEENDRFLVTLIGTDLSDVETLYYEVNTVENDSGTIEVVLEDLIGDNDITFDELETQDRDSITLELAGVNGSVSNARAYINFTESASGTLYYNKAVSEKGLVITLPTSTTGMTDGSGETITFTEADKDDDLTEGTAFTATVKNTSNTKLHVSTHNLTAYDEEESDESYIGYVPSDLASKIMFDTSADEYDFEVEYYGEEVTADVSVAAGGTVETTTGALGDVLVMDSEVNSVDANNLVIVGGSCINSAAATVLGGAYCGAAFTEATGVANGEFLIKGIENSAIDGKFALVVAGYEAADTVNAATYLTMKTVDTSMTYKGTSKTEASVVTTTA